MTNKIKGDKMITQIDHIEIIVKDVKTYVDYYQKLGFKLLTWTDHHGGSAELQLPGPNQPIFEIHTVLGEENIGINHIAFQADDVKKTFESSTGKVLNLMENHIGIVILDAGMSG